MLRVVVCAVIAAACLAGVTATWVPSSCSSAGTCTSAIQTALDDCMSNNEPCVIEFDNQQPYLLEGQPQGICMVKAEVSTQFPTAPPSFTVHGNGAEIHIAPLAGFACLGGLRNVFVSNFSVDMVRVPFSLGRVVSSTALDTVFDVDLAEYPQATPSGHWTNQVQAILQFSPSNNRPAAGGYDAYGTFTASWGAGPNSSFASVTVSKGHIALGSWQILRHQVYGFNGITLGGVTNATIEDVVLYSVPGMGFVAQESTGITLRRSGVQKRPGRPMSITADGMHLTSCRGGDVHVEECLFEGQGDDGGNIPSRYWEMREISADRRTLQLWQRGSMNPFGGLPGDPLLFYNRTSFSAYGRGGAVQIQSINATAGTVTMTQPLPAVGAIWDLVLNLANQPRSITVRDSVFRDNRARGFILKASNVAVINCTFDHNTGPAIRVVPDGANWFEGDVVSQGNWTMSGCRVTGVNYATAANPGDVFFGANAPKFVNGSPTTATQQVMSGTQHFNVSIVDTVFEQDTGKAAVAAYGVDGLSLQGNQINTMPGAAPAADNFLLSSSVLHPSMSGNVCDGKTCTTGPLSTD